jgi:hypothetical protein
VKVELADVVRPGTRPETVTLSAKGFTDAEWRGNR